MSTTHGWVHFASRHSCHQMGILSVLWPIGSIRALRAVMRSCQSHGCDQNNIVHVLYKLYLIPKNPIPGQILPEGPLIIIEDGDGKTHGHRYLITVGLINHPCMLWFHDHIETFIYTPYLRQQRTESATLTTELSLNGTKWR